MATYDESVYYEANGERFYKYVHRLKKEEKIKPCWRHLYCVVNEAYFELDGTVYWTSADLATHGLKAPPREFYKQWGKAWILMTVTPRQDW